MAERGKRRLTIERVGNAIVYTATHADEYAAILAFDEACAILKDDGDLTVRFRVDPGDIKEYRRSVSPGDGKGG